MIPAVALAARRIVGMTHRHPCSKKQPSDRQFGLNLCAGGYFPNVTSRVRTPRTTTAKSSTPTVFLSDTCGSPLKTRYSIQSPGRSFNKSFWRKQTIQKPQKELNPLKEGNTGIITHGSSLCAWGGGGGGGGEILLDESVVYADLGRGLLEDLQEHFLGPNHDLATNKNLSSICLRCHLWV